MLIKTPNQLKGIISIAGILKTMGRDTRKLHEQLNKAGLLYDALREAGGKKRELQGKLCKAAERVLAGTK